MKYLITIVLCLLPMIMTAQTKRALVIGLGEQEDKSWAKINGDKDIPYVVGMLMKNGYIDIRTLVNKGATKADIITAFNKLTDICSVGDIVYIHFSGHGQQVTDVNGDEGEKNEWDEAWIPYDAYLRYDKNGYKGEKHLIDDELNTLLTAIRNKIGNIGKMMVVVDACHSGGSTRGKNIEGTVRGVKDEFIIPISKRGNEQQAPEQWLTLSACKDYQLNQEMKDEQENSVGRLTYALYMTTQNGVASFEKINDFMEEHRTRIPQTPEQTGDTINQKLSDFLK